MSTPFDRVVEHIASVGYHNHRLESHSDIVSNGIFDDLLKACPPLSRDVSKDVVRRWLNVRAPGARERKIDLFIGEPQRAGTRPDIKLLRVCAENKSVVTAHRNRDARFDDLNETMKVVHGVRKEAVIVATIMIGTASNVLNIPDAVKKQYRMKMGKFEKGVLPRLSTGDQSLWDEFDWAVSANKTSDPARTVAKFRQLPVRSPAHTHVEGYDFVLLVPVRIDNVNPPMIDRDNSRGIDIDRDYKKMITTICKAYRARWHL